MSVHYLIDPFTVGGDIIDVVTSETGQTESTGSVVVRIPDGAFIQGDPVDRTALLTEKYDSLLASYAGFTQIVSDPCLDSLTFDVANAQRAFFSQGFANHALSPATPNGMTTTSVTLPLTPTVAVILWEEYSFTDTDDKTGRFQRTYVEGSGSDLTCTVSFDNGANFNAVTNGAVFNIPVSDQGTEFSIGFTNTSSSRVYLGSWAVIF